MKKSFTFILVLCLVKTTFQLQDVTWVEELSTPRTTYWGRGSKTSWKAALIFPEEHAKFLFITYNDVYEATKIYPDDVHGYNCALYPGENRPYFCSYVKYPDGGSTLLDIRTFIDRTHVKDIVPGEPVIFEIDAIRASGNFLFKLHLHNGGTLDSPDLSGGTVQNIAYRGQPIPHFRIISTTCRKTPCQSEGLQMTFSDTELCGWGCQRRIKCDINKRYYQDVTSVSICQNDADWSESCHSCPRVYQIDSIPPNEKNVFNGSNVKLNAVLHFPTNPSNYLKAVWEIQSNQKRRRVMECLTVSEDILQCESLSTGWQDRIQEKIQEKSLLEIKYPQTFNLTIGINNLELADDGLQVIFSLIDPEDVVIPIYKTKLIVTTGPVAAPVTNETVTNETVTNETVTNETVTIEPVTNEPVTNEPVTNEPVTNEPAASEEENLLNSGDYPIASNKSKEEISKETDNGAARSKYHSNFAFVFSAFFTILNRF